MKSTSIQVLFARLLNLLSLQREYCGLLKERGEEASKILKAINFRISQTEEEIYEWYKNELERDEELHP